MSSGRIDKFTKIRYNHALAFLLHKMISTGRAFGERRQYELTSEDFERLEKIEQNVHPLPFSGLRGCLNRATVKAIHDPNTVYRVYLEPMQAFEMQQMLKR